MRFYKCDVKPFHLCYLASLSRVRSHTDRERLSLTVALHTPLPAAHPPLSSLSILPSRSFQNMICVIQLGCWILFTNHSCLFKRDYSLCRSCIQLGVKSCVCPDPGAYPTCMFVCFFFFSDILLSAFLHQRATIFFCVSCSYE